MQYKITMSCLIAAVLFAVSPAVRAADTNAPVPGAPAAPSPNGPAPSMQPRMRPMPAPSPQNPLMRVMTEEQHKSYDEATAANHEKLMDLQKQFMDVRKKLNDAQEAALTNNFDEALIRSLVMEEGKIQADVLILNTKVLTQIRPPLTAEQIDELKNPRPPQTMMRPMPSQPVPVPPGANTSTNSLPPKPPE